MLDKMFKVFGSIIMILGAIAIICMLVAFIKMTLELIY